MRLPGGPLVMIDMRTVCEISVYRVYIGVRKIMVFICRHYENCPGYIYQFQ